MISTSVYFWKAFFDPANPNHDRARSDVLLFDREKIILSPFVIAEITSWLIEAKKIKQKNWFLDFAQNTTNTRIFLFGREEFAAILKIAFEEDLTLDNASLEYLRRIMNCDITEY